MKLLIDISSVLGSYMHLPDEEYGEDFVIDGKKWHVPALETCMERAEYSLQGVLDRLNISPSDIIAVRDPESPGAQRKRLFPGYKAGREKRPPQFYAVMNQLVEDFCEMIMQSGGICATPRVTPSIEADDLINALAEKLPDCIIYSKDKDLLSCPAKHHLIDKELDPLPYPVPREYIRLYRAIVTGDASDNISSCKGFGEKAWDKMVALIGPDGVAELDKMVQERRLHELEDDVADFKPFRLLIDQADAVYLAYKVMSFIPVPDHKIRWEARCQDCTKTLVTRKNYEEALREIKQALRENDLATIDFESAVDEEAEAWLKGTFDPETGKQAVMVDVIGSVPTGMGLKVGTQTWYISVDHADTDNCTIEQLGVVIDLLKNKMVLGHNATNFENVLLHNHFGGFLEGMIDTRLAASYVDENDSLGLKKLSKRWLNYDQTSYEEVLGGAKNMREISGQQVLNYGLDDVITTESLWNLFKTIMEVEGSFDAFMKIERESAFVTSLAFIDGIDFDEAVHARLREENGIKTQELQTKIEQQLLALGWGETEFKPLPNITLKSHISCLYETVTGRPFTSKARSVKGCLPDIDDDRVRDAVAAGPEAMNVLYQKFWKPRAELNTRSPKQMVDLLYVTLGCPVRIVKMPTDRMREKGLSGNPAADETAIENAIAFRDPSPEGVELLKNILALKGCLTKESLFFRKYKPLVHWKTGKIHGGLTQCGTTTRRFTHSAPNWAQSSKKKGKEMRNMVKAPEGYSLVSFDWSGQELRLQAWFSKDANFLACYQGPKEQRKDLHSQMGFTITSHSPEPLCDTYEEFAARVEAGDSVAKGVRATGKAVVFSSAYGCRAKKLAAILRTTEAEAESYLKAKLAAFPDFAPAVDAWNDLCERRGYSLTPLGARRHLHKSFAMARSQGDKDAVRRLAFSFAIQSAGAEMAKLTMARLWRRGVFRDKKCSIFSVIHDELVGVIRNDLLEEMIPVWHEAMTAQYADMEIDLESTPEVGSHFGSLKPWDLERGTFKS